MKVQAKSLEIPAAEQDDKLESTGPLVLLVADMFLSFCSAGVDGYYTSTYMCT